MQYDCTKTADFIHEIKRLYNSCTAETHDECKVCPLTGVCGDGIGDLNESHIEAMQKWSDEHPEKTRSEWFQEQFPNCEIHVRYGNIPQICPTSLSQTIKCPRLTGECGCIECWSKPYKEEDFQ